MTNIACTELRWLREETPKAFSHKAQGWREARAPSLGKEHFQDELQRSSAFLGCMCGVRNRVAVVPRSPCTPRVARSSQLWALIHNAVGVGSLATAQSRTRSKRVYRKSEFGEKRPQMTRIYLDFSRDHPCHPRSNPTSGTPSKSAKDAKICRANPLSSFAPFASFVVTLFLERWYQVVAPLQGFVQKRRFSQTCARASLDLGWLVSGHWSAMHRPLSKCRIVSKDSREDRLSYKER